MAKNIIISSTYFPRKNIHKQTWTSPNGKTKSQIDHIVIDKRYQTCIKNVRTYRGADGDSDHYLVIPRFVLTLSVKWRNKKQFNKAVKLDGDKLKNSNEIRERTELE